MRRNSRDRGSAMSMKATESTTLVKKNYGTLTERSEGNDNPDIFELQSDPEEEENLHTISIDDAMNRIKPYRLFFIIGILPMVLSFACSDLIVDSLNFLELVPFGLE